MLYIFRIAFLIFVVFAQTDTTPFHETASRQGEANADQADEQLNNEASIILKTVGIYKIMNLVRVHNPIPDIRIHESL